MTSFKFDVIIVGAGPAGITAAISLAKADVSVLVIEAGVFPGAENWSGAVYFTENLAHPDVLGEKAVAESAFERPVTKRGFYIYNGHSLVGLGYRNPSTFANCYTVLRPTYDHYLAELARSFGATILTETTVDGLLRDEHDQIIGVHTDRGSIYSDVVFLAEGDAAHLVTKEGYERSREPGAPHFLQGIKEIIELDPDDIERHFHLPRGEGAAYEILLRNGSIHNRPVHLNMGGFIYTNRASVSIGLVMPLDNLASEFSGDHNRLMEWFKSLPEIRRWSGGGRSVAYGAKIIRGGGFRDLPQLVDDGLAIGGAATGIGLDFPYPNFTGPATAMGRLFANAVKEIRATDRHFSRLRLEELYERPLRQTHYFRNVEFLEKWPHYVEHTRVFFGRAADLATGSLYIASNRSLHAGQKFWQLAKFLRETLPPRHWKEFFADLREQREALGLNEVSQLSVEAPTDPSARPGEGEVTVEFRVDGQPQSEEQFLWPISRLLQRLPRVLPVACDHLYRNDNIPLPVKLRNAIRSFRKQLGIGGFVAVALFALLSSLLIPVQWLCEMVWLLITRPSPEKYLSGFFQRYRAVVRQCTNLDPVAVKVEQPWEEKLSLVRYFSESGTHIKVQRPDHFQDRTKIAESPLWHVCPAKVYEDKVDDLGQVQIVVNFENCIKCETCWRAAPADVDWTRQRKQRLIFSAPTEANKKLLALMKQSGTGVPPVHSWPVDRRDACPTELTLKLRQFCDAVGAEPRYIDAARARWLGSLLEQAQALAPTDKRLARILAHAKRRKFFWAEADARALLESIDAVGRVPSRGESDNAEAARAASGDAAYNGQLSLRSQLDKLFPKQVIKDLEHGGRMTDERLAFLHDLADAISSHDPHPVATASRSYDTLPRSIALSELARKDPSFAVLVSGIYPAQIAARPELADIPWIGLTAARSYWKDFPASPQPLTLPQVAADVLAIALGAGEMLLERCRAHATSRVQFPGLFKDEDGRDGIAKFGAVKCLLSEMEAQLYLLEALQEVVGGWRFRATTGEEHGHDGAWPSDDVAAMIKILASEAFGPEPGSFAYNAGQIFGGTAYSEDDVLAKFYRDSACFPRLVFDNAQLRLQLGQDVDAKLRQFALDAVKRHAGEAPSELEAEIVKMVESRMGVSPVHIVRSSGRDARSTISLGAAVLERGYIEQPLQHPPAFSYRDALKTEQTYDHGDFLVKPLDPNQWRYAPEMLFADAELRAYHEQLYRFFTDTFSKKRFGMGSDLDASPAAAETTSAAPVPYYRLVEKLHMVPLGDVRDMIARGFTRMYIPKDLGGEGLLKAYYYILCPLSMRYADPSYALTIMAHSSIGTTPILLGLNQDLPRAKADLQAFLADSSVVSNLKSQISQILRMLDSPEALKVKKVFTDLGDTVRNQIGRKPMLRAVASEFLGHFTDAGRAGLRMDLTNSKSELQKSLGALEPVRSRAEAVVAELDRRAEAARLFLKLISAGQISAFALTEPSAGSDSGGIQTRAELKRVDVLTDSDSLKYFMIGGERRNILDAPSVDLTKIDYSQYDYGRSTGLRYYQHNGTRVPFHDIAQIRREVAGRLPSGGDDIREFYEYYELNGAKMWITNGHVAGVMCLYARTAEGPTGFMVDRHAEGLVVGKDEEKMGQRGSPTNELGLTSVRVPRENIIGIEGRGQVNALETLDVGRTGLCISATAMIAKIVEQTRTFVREHNLGQPEWVQETLGEMAMELYAVESLAYELIGRFDHHGTKDVRTESAIGKYYASEALHRVIRAAETIYGIEGVTQLHELEKHRRDARVLNIYEGTNEVQRFLILRDLVDSVLPKSVGRVPSRGESDAIGTTRAASGDAAHNIETMKEMLLHDLKQAVDLFGPQVWQNANFQPTMFKLAEIAGYIKLMESVLWRTQWLSRHVGQASRLSIPGANQTNVSSPSSLRTAETAVPPGPGETPDLVYLQIAEHASSSFLAHATAETQHLHDDFERDFELLQQGLYPPEIRTAFLALQAEEGRKKQPPRSLPSQNITKPLRIVVALNVVPVLSPRPRVIDGELLETHFEIDAASRAALENALEVKLGGAGVSPAQSGQQDGRDARPTVHVSALAVAPRYAIELLRRALALGADDAALIRTDEATTDLHATARLLANHLGVKGSACDLLLCGDPLLATVLAGNLGLASVTGVQDFCVAAADLEITLQSPAVTFRRSGPIVLDIVSGETVRDYTVDDYLAAQSKPLLIVEARELSADSQFETRFALPDRPVVQETIEATPESAAALVRTLAGVARGHSDDSEKTFAGAVELVARSRIPLRNAALLVATPETLDVLDVASVCAEALLLPLHVVILCAADEKKMRRLAAQISTDSVYFVTNPSLRHAPAAGVLAALQMLWKDTLPPVLVSGTWANDILARFAMTFPRVQAQYNVSAFTAKNGVVELVAPVFGGKVNLITKVSRLGEHPLVMTIAERAEGRVSESGKRKAESQPRVFHVPLEFDYDPETDEMAKTLRAATAETGVRSIADADFIIDAGYALRNKENFDRIVNPLKQRLEEIGVKNVIVGGTRKVVEELKLLTPDRQIGQTGTAVNPKVMISIGVSGAPQHLDYIGDRATIIAFNKDPEAPLMTLNSRRARPKVIPIVGDLYELVPQFTRALKS